LVFKAYRKSSRFSWRRRKSGSMSYSFKLHQRDNLRPSPIHSFPLGEKNGNYGAGR